VVPHATARLAPRTELTVGSRFVAFEVRRRV